MPLEYYAPGARMTVLGRWLLALSMIGMAIVCILNGSFAFERQPVPASWPFRPALIYLSAATLGVSGIALLTTHWQRYGAAVLAATFLLWTVALHLPKIIAAEPVAWLAAAECLAIAAGAAALMVWRCADRRAEFTSEAARITFGLTLLAFGAAHFIYADFTAKLVPGWMPVHLFWAYATGVAHAASGLSILSGVLTRLASTLLVWMMGTFVVLVNLPAAIAATDFGRETAHFLFALALTGSAALIAGQVRIRSVEADERRHQQVSG